MLSKLYGYLAAVGAFALLVLGLVLQNKKIKRQAVKIADAKRVSKVSEAVAVETLQSEIRAKNEVREAVKNPTNHFLNDGVHDR